MTTMRPSHSRLCLRVSRTSTRSRSPSSISKRRWHKARDPTAGEAEGRLSRRSRTCRFRPTRCSPLARSRASLRRLLRPLTSAWTKMSRQGSSARAPRLRLRCRAARPMAGHPPLFIRRSRHDSPFQSRRRLRRPRRLAAANASTRLRPRRLRLRSTSLAAHHRSRRSVPSQAYQRSSRGPPADRRGAHPLAPQQQAQTGTAARCIRLPGNRPAIRGGKMTRRAAAGRRERRRSRRA